MKSLKDISKILQDYERRLIALEGKKKTVHSKQYRFKSGSTADKIVKLISEGFFNKHRSIKDIIVKLKEKDFHLQASDLTLPLRKIVRKDLLRKTKQLPGGTISKKWLYVRP